MTGPCTHEFLPFLLLLAKYPHKLKLIKVVASRGKRLRKLHSYLEFYWQLLVARERTDIFLQDCDAY